MAKKYVKRSRKAGLPPGSLIHVGREDNTPVKITVFDYNEGFLEERQVEDVNECFKYRDTPTMTWINIDGLTRPDIIERLGEQFGLHHLVLEDILNTEQRPKKEDMGAYIHLSLKMLYLDTTHNGKVVAEHVSLICGPNYVLSFQEGDKDVFNSVRERLRTGKGRLRRMGSDYLAYSLIDNVIDNYFSVLELIGEKLNGLEDELVDHPTPETLRTLYSSKRATLFLRKSVWPLREVIGGLAKMESPLIQPQTIPYLRDIYDHTIEVMDIVETYRDMQAGMLDTYLSSLSNHLNQVMKVLTIITTIFMPLSFIAGVYGMNFKHMPELEWMYGYPFAIGLMLFIVIIMMVFFRRRGWI